MSKLYLIGGAPHTGKSITRRLVMQTGEIINSLDTDTLRHLYRFDPTVMPYEQQALLWDSAMLAMSSWLKYKGDSILEGTLVTPPRVAQVCRMYPEWIGSMRVAFLGNARLSVQEKSAFIADSATYPGETNWPNITPDMNLAWIAEESIQHSIATEQEVARLKQDFPALSVEYFDTTNGFFRGTQAAAMYISTGLINKN